MDSKEVTVWAGSAIAELAVTHRASETIRKSSLALGSVAVISACETIESMCEALTHALWTLCWQLQAEDAKTDR
jgi:hypothetical protein